MNIEKIDPIGFPDPVKRVKATTPPESVKKGDAISLSQEARLKSELFATEKAVKETPDVREDRIAEVKAKIESDQLFAPESLDTVADRIVDLFNL